MSRDELLADLQVDAGRRQPPPLRAAPVPALELRLTPLHWSAPAVRRSDGLVLTAGPVTVTLHR